MKEVLEHYSVKIEHSEILKQLNLTTSQYFVVSVHREENVDNTGNLIKIVNLLNSLARDYQIPVIVSTHPRTRKRLTQLKDIPVDPHIQFLKPFGFVDYIKLQMNALCTVSDSGTISEESAILGFAAISLRQSMERPEAMDAGTIILTGFDTRTVTDSVRLAIESHSVEPTGQIAQDYTITNTSWRVLKLIMGLSGLSNQWNNIINKD